MKTRHEQDARMICHAKTTVEHVVMDSSFYIRVLVEGDLPTKILYSEFSPTVNFTNRNFERRNLPRSFGWNCPHRNFPRSFNRKSPHGNLPTVKIGIFPAGTLSRGIIPTLENGIFPTGTLSTGI